MPRASRKMPLLLRARLGWFDLVGGTPSAVAVLARRLGPWRAVRALAAFVRRGLGPDPFAPLGPDGPRDVAEAFTRHQLAPVLRLDAVLRRDLGLETAQVLDLLAEVVARSGARFIRATVSFPDRGEWEALDGEARDRLVRRRLARFLNAEAEIVRAPGADVAFDVHRCHFVELSARLERPELAPLFCGADQVFFSAGGAPARLSRETTLATGGDRCPFRLSMG